MLSVEKLFLFSLRIALQPALGISSLLISVGSSAGVIDARQQKRKLGVVSRILGGCVEWWLALRKIHSRALEILMNLRHPWCDIKYDFFRLLVAFLHLVIFLLRYFDTPGSLRNNWLMKWEFRSRSGASALQLSNAKICQKRKWRKRILCLNNSVAEILRKLFKERVESMRNGSERFRKKKRFLVRI